jgi:hypothetical protein
MSGSGEIKEGRNKPPPFRKEFPIQNDGRDDIFKSLQNPHDIGTVCKGTGIAYIQDLFISFSAKLRMEGEKKYITIWLWSEFSSWFIGNP